MLTALKTDGLNQRQPENVRIPNDEVPRYTATQPSMKSPDMMKARHAESWSGMWLVAESGPGTRYLRLKR
jgi:hypothetical protein